MVISESPAPSKLGLSIAWHNIPTQLGGFPGLGADRTEGRKAYLRLLQPEGRFYVIGDQVTPLMAWQEGALMSMESAVNDVLAKNQMLIRIAD